MSHWLALHFPKVCRRQQRRNPVEPQCKTGRQLELSSEDFHVNSCGINRFPSIVIQLSAGRRAHGAIRWGFDGPSGADHKTGSAGVASYRRYRLHPRSSDEHDQRLSSSALSAFSQSIGSFKNTRARSTLTCRRSGGIAAPSTTADRRSPTFPPLFRATPTDRNYPRRRCLSFGTSAGSPRWMQHRRLLVAQRMCELNGEPLATLGALAAGRDRDRQRGWYKGSKAAREAGRR